MGPAWPKFPLFICREGVLFSFPSAATARQTRRSLSSHFLLGPGAGGTLVAFAPRVPGKPHRRCVPSSELTAGSAPQRAAPEGSPKPLAPGFVPQNPSPRGFVPEPRAWETRNWLLSCCCPGGSGAKVSSPTPKVLTSRISFWIRVWRQRLGLGIAAVFNLRTRAERPLWAS